MASDILASMRVRTRRRLLSALVLLLLIITFSRHPQWHSKAEQQSSTASALYTVNQVFDGGTIAVTVNGANEKVRLLGIDTPETHAPHRPAQCFGDAATTFTRDSIDGQKIRLEADPLNADRDQYNRLLRYVYLPDNTLFNAEIVRQGYGFAYTRYPVTKAREFQSLQTQAREEKRGLWSSCQPHANEYGDYISNDTSR